MTKSNFKENVTHRAWKVDVYLDSCQIMLGKQLHTAITESWIDLKQTNKTKGNSRLQFNKHKNKNYKQQSYKSGDRNLETLETFRRRNVVEVSKFSSRGKHDELNSDYNAAKKKRRDER